MVASSLTCAALYKTNTTALILSLLFRKAETKSRRKQKQASKWVLMAVVHFADGFSRLVP